MTDIPDPPQSTEDILAMTRWLEAVTLKLRGITEGRDLSVAQAAAQLVLNGAVVNGSTNPASPVTPGQVDTSPPPQPTGLSVSDGMGTIFISWNAEITARWNEAKPPVSKIKAYTGRQHVGQTILDYICGLLLIGMFVYFSMVVLGIN